MNYHLKITLFALTFLFAAGINSPIYPADTPVALPGETYPVNLSIAEALEIIHTEPGLKQIGNTEATVVVTEFTDFRCFFCQRYANEIFPTLFKEYIWPGKILYQFKHFPVTGSEAFEIAAEGECAGEQNLFWQFKHRTMTRMLENQDKNISSLLDAVKEELEIPDEEKFVTCIDSEETERTVQEDLETGREKNLRSTPSVLINDEEVIGLYPIGVYRGIIEYYLE